MSSYSEFLREDIRLVTLRLLSEMPAYRSNSSVLVTCLDQLGHCVSRDYVKTELCWLTEQGLVKIEDIGSVLVATLTERGADVAAGRSRVSGVKRPGA